MRRELLTRWGRDLDPEHVLPEYPRPQLVRDSYLNLNGWWDYAITAGVGPAARGVRRAHPGAVLPRGAAVRGRPAAAARRAAELPPHASRCRTGSCPRAAGCCCTSGPSTRPARCGSTASRSAPTPAATCPSPATSPTRCAPAANELVVDVRDLSDGHQHASGKQRLHRGGIWYTAQSGIWQTVWLEAVPAVYVERLTLVPHLDDGTRRGDRARGSSGARADGAASAARPRRVAVEHSRPGSPLDDVAALDPGGPAPLRRRGAARRGPGHVLRRRCARSGSAPTSTASRGCCSTARRTSTSACSTRATGPTGCSPRPSDEAMVHDIATMKRLGFTMLRSAVLVAPERRRIATSTCRR